MMAYYKLACDISSKVVGNFPQVQREDWGLVEQPDSIMDYFGRTAASGVFLPKFVLYKRARQTDMYSGFGMALSYRILVSKKLVELLSGFKVFGLNFLKVDIVSLKDGLLDGYLVNPADFCFDAIDLSNSEISYKTKATCASEGVNLHFETNEEIRREYERYYSRVGTGTENRTLMMCRAAIKANAPVDFFALPFSTSGPAYFVSKSLRDAFEESGLSGIRYLAPSESV